MISKITRISSILLLTLALTACNSGPEGEIVDAVAEQQAPQAISGTTYNLDASTSTINWHAYKVVGEHVGTIGISSGTVSLNGDGIPESGSFTIDMSTITSDTDAVTNHLKKSDFFEIETYPTSKFEITSATKDKISGNLTMKDKTHNITFPYTLTVEGDIVKASAEFAIDRTKWGINFRSGQFFEGLGDSMIKDEFELKLDITAKK